MRLPQDVPSLSGALATLHGELVDELYGAGTFASALAKVPSETRDRYKMLTAISWVPVDRVQTVFESVGAHVGARAEDVYYRVARRSVDRRMRTVWRVLLRLTSDEFLVARAQTFYGKAYSVGYVTAAIDQPGRGIVTVHDWPAVPPFVLRGLCAGVESVLAVAQRRNITGRATSTPNGGVCQVNWTV